MSGTYCKYRSYPMVSGTTPVHVSITRAFERHSEKRGVQRRACGPRTFAKVNLLLALRKPVRVHLARLTAQLHGLTAVGTESVLAKRHPGVQVTLLQSADITSAVSKRCLTRRCTLPHTSSRSTAMGSYLSVEDSYRWHRFVVRMPQLRCATDC